MQARQAGQARQAKQGVQGGADWKGNEPSACKITSSAIEFVHADGSKDVIEVNHTYNQSQIDWYNEGSALNLIKKENK